MDLEASVRAAIIGRLPHDRGDSATIAELSALSMSALAIRYFNWHMRLVQPIPRSVHHSREFSANSGGRSLHSAALGDILTSIERGTDLTPRLSKGIEEGYVAGSASSSPDKDLLLNDWGVHHLHLGTAQDTRDPNYIGRTGDLLFVIFRPQAAYLLDIFPHKKWTEREIVRIAVSNWPNLNFFVELKGAVPATGVGITEAEHQRLRRAGITALVELNGRMFTRPGGLSSAGTSYDANRAASDLLGRVAAFSRSLSDTQGTAARLRRAGVTPPSEPDFEFVLLQHGYGVREKSTGALIKLSD